VGLLTRRSDQDDARFRGSWRQAHGIAVKNAPGLRRYHQNDVVDRSQKAIVYQRGPLDVDGFSQEWFDDYPSMRQPVPEDEVGALSRIERTFLSDLKIVVAVPHVVIPTPPGNGGVKRMSLLRRRPDVSPEMFQQEWFDVHSVLVKRLPRVRGYVQNLILDRAAGLDRRPATYDELPLDGIVELWFDGEDDVDATFTADAGRTLMTHASEFISEISTFLVDTHDMLGPTPRA
jgi:hypothetical protein